MTSKGLENSITKFKDLSFFKRYPFFGQDLFKSFEHGGGTASYNPSGRCFDFYICINKIFSNIQKRRKIARK